MDPVSERTGDLKPLIPISQTAQILGISRSTVYRLVERREIPCIRIGSRILFKQELLQQWIESQVQSVEVCP
jgi:excisionase family DNA binding protein